MSLEVIEETIPKPMRMCASKDTRKNFARKSRLKPRQQKLIFLKPKGVIKVDLTGATIIVGEKLRWNMRTHNHICEIMHVNVWFYLLTPHMEVLFIQFVCDLERELKTA